MAAADDDLAALDALDAAISDPQRDDDDALDAYEELIALAARDAAPAPALSKTAQLLTKHFARFPHVHANVLDALLALCVRARPQAVRIHTLRALIQLARTLSPDARERVHAAVAALAATETSGVITRTMNELGKVLRDRSKADKPPMDKAKDPEQRGKKDQKARAESVDGSGTNAPAAAATGERDKTTSRDPDLRATLNESREERRQRDEEAAGARKKQRLEELLARPPDSPVRVPNGPGAYACPPSPYIHLSNVPHGARPADVAAFLSTVDAGIKAYCVHIKFAPGASTGYAFASLATTPLAVEAIRFAKAEKFRGAFLVANFARGPACNTITFAWRNDRGWALAPDGSLRTFDFSRCKSAVWSRLCDTLRRFGEMDVLEQGKVRFHNIEHAKEVIKTNHFTVQSFDLAPVYSLAEQQENDATRPRHDAQAVRQGFALKSGRVVGDREPDDRRGQRQSTERSATGSRRQDENEREHGDRTRAKESIYSSLCVTKCAEADTGGSRPSLQVAVACAESSDATAAGPLDRSSRPEEPRAVSPAVASRNASAERRRRSNSPRSREWKPPRDSHRSLPSPPPPSSNQRDIRGSEHALHRRQSRSRSGERERFVARDMSSYAGAGVRLGDRDLCPRRFLRTRAGLVEVAAHTRRFRHIHASAASLTLDEAIAEDARRLRRRAWAATIVIVLHRHWGTVATTAADRRMAKPTAAFASETVTMGVTTVLTVNNRNRANRQASSSASRREVFSPAFGSASSPAGKREVRAFPPSPARRGDATNKRSTRERSRSRSPLGRRAPWSTGDADANRSSEKKRRVVVVDDDDDDVLVLPKPSAAAAFDDMDEMMVDYEED
ncbi:hypothetical protein PybrP1_008735 [[Pythium] brassicae (nom. inval.)]|nr:hypothetical protein PybrP1_008735 [[Pythium] brassicae (nom. inval.)]